MKIVAVLFLLGSLSGCATVNDAPVQELSTVSEWSGAAEPVALEHVVLPGDTLYGIAFRHDLDHRQLAEWNALSPPFTLRPGQRVRLTSPSDSGAIAEPARPAGVVTSAAPDRSVAATTQALYERPPPATPSPTPRPAVPPRVVPPPATGPVSTAARVPSQPTPPAAAPAQPRPAPPPPPPAATSPAPVPKPAAPVIVATGPAQTVAGIAWRWPANGRVVNRYVAGDPARQGVDIQGALGQPVVATADGEVVYSGNGLIGYGELVIVKHSNEFLSAYGHNRKRLVAEGDRVRAGQQIAEMGRSASALDLLHFEIRRAGKTVDPLTFLPRR